MSSENTINTLSNEGLLSFQRLQSDAVNAVTKRFYSTFDGLYQRFGEKGKQSCREDLNFHLEFLRPVLEFGILQPMIDYLHWLNGVLSARSIPTQHLVQSLDWLGEYFAEHMDAQEGAKVVSALIAAREGFLKKVDTPLSPRLVDKPWPEMVTFESAILAGDQQGALDLLTLCLEQGHALIEIELHIIQPALYDIGEKWQANQVSVAQEHMATATALSVMTIILQKSQPLAANHKRVLLACVEGNHHAVGLQMVAHAFLLSGWEVQYLGSNVPSSALIQQTSNWKPDLIGLSVSFPQQVRIAKAVMGELSEHFGRARPAVIIGGLAFNPLTALVDVVGADLFGIDAQSAVNSVTHLVNQ